MNTFFNKIMMIFEVMSKMSQKYVTFGPFLGDYWMIF